MFSLTNQTSPIRSLAARTPLFLRRLTERTRLQLAGFQVSITGRFWVSTEAASGVSLVSAPAGRLYSGTTRRAPHCGQLLSVKDLIERSTPLSGTTIARIDPSSGPLRPIPSWQRSLDFVQLFPGHDTSVLS